MSQWDLQQHKKECVGLPLIFVTISLFSHFIKWKIKQTEESVASGNGHTSHLMSTQEVSPDTKKIINA
jgi:hypothetical protein